MRLQRPLAFPDGAEQLVMSDTAEYDFELPKELIAQRPLATRSDARLMIVDRRTECIDHAHVRDVPDVLRHHDCLVVNDSRVIPARVDGYRETTRGRWQGLFLAEDSPGVWQLLCKTRGRLKEGERIVLTDRLLRDDAHLRMLARLDEGVWAARLEADESTWDLLDRIGKIPLPHYIRGGEMVDNDRLWYQTVFAARRGSVAAPTAGLHLTQKLLERLSEQGVSTAAVTLHIGLATFRPITAEQVEQHQMHAEWGEIDESAVQKIRAAKQSAGRVVAVGTTSVRVLETAAADGSLDTWSGQTELFIRPGYEFRVVDALMTNFHLPRSTLLVLIRTFGGDALMRRAYQEAIAERYRFFSYGDAMLIL